VDIIPTGTSDNEVIKVFNSYVNIPALLWLQTRVYVKDYQQTRYL
jgi:hypothetical protein